MKTSLPHWQRAANVDARGVGKANALFHQLIDQPRLQGALGFCQLLLVVDTHHLCPVVGLDAVHRHTIVDRHRNHVSQIILALRIVVAKIVEPGAQLVRRADHHTRVDLPNRLSRPAPRPFPRQYN